jgi:PAS domain S-box-containing protein
LQALIDSSPLALVEFGPDTRIRLWNPAAERIFGWTREEMIGRGGLPMAPADLRAESEDLFERVHAGESINDYETLRLSKDGTLVAVSIAAAPVRDASGAVIGNLVAYTDITDRREQEKRLQALIDSSPLALVEFGLDTRIRLWNPAAERIFGWTREEMIGRGGLPMAPPDRQEESEELFARVEGGQPVYDFETVRQRKDGSLVPVSIAAAPVNDASGGFVGNLVAYTDISERKTQEAEVHRLNAELHARLDELAASRARIVAAGDVERRRLERNLHDGAQQRLVSLALSIRVAMAKLDSDPAAAREVLSGAADELARALDELRELARGLHPAVLSDRGLRAAVEMLAGRAALPVEIAAVPDERLPGPVEAGAYYLISEALTNVAKYAHASVVRVSVVAGDDRVVVEVSDDGVGGADPAAGSGLRGLADRVEALGGTLEVTSPAGQGTTLRAEVPRGRLAS